MSFSKRILIYSKEQLEPVQRFLLSLLVSLFVALLVKLDFEKETLDWKLLVPTLSSFLLLLYYRISDEFKDYQTDLKFFPDRPIPSGRLFLSDLKVLLAFVSLIGALLNFIYPDALYEYFAAFLFTVAMGKWFFLEKWISKNRLLAFITHAPVGLFLYWYVITFILNDHNIIWSMPEKLSVIGYIVLPGLSWEILRKTYLPQDEMPGYQIYSTMLGFKGSLGFASFWIILTFMCDLFMARLFPAFENLELFFSILNLSLLIVVILHARKPLMKNLKPVTEVYMTLHLLVPLAVLAYRGLNQ